MGRIMEIKQSSRGLEVYVSSLVRASAGAALLAAGEVGYADATGGLTSKRDGKARGVGLPCTARRRG